MKKSSNSAQIQTRFRVHADDLIEWFGRRPDPKKLARLGLTPRQWQLWLGNPDGVWLDAALYHLPRFHHRLSLGELIGKEWEGFAIHGDSLEFPGLKRTVPARELQSLWFQIQQVPALNAHVARLTKENDRMAEALEAAEQRADFYRRQLKLESSMGLMLARVAL